MIRATTILRGREPVSLTEHASASWDLWSFVDVHETPQPIYNACYKASAIRNLWPNLKAWKADCEEGHFRHVSVVTSATLPDGRRAESDIATPT
jgi:hypothetical protein